MAFCLGGNEFQDEYWCVCLRDENCTVFVTGVTLRRS